MGWHGWRSMSGKTLVFVVLAAAYYLALNGFLLNEIIYQVRTGPQVPAAARPQPSNSSGMQNPAACGDLAGMNREICRAELRAGQVSARLRERTREERRERRAAREERRKAASAAPALANAGHREIAAATR
jgi:uncharacterized membrane protein